MSDTSVESCITPKLNYLIISSNSQYSPEVQALVDAANTARDEFRTAERASNDVDHDVQVIFNLELVADRVPD